MFILDMYRFKLEKEPDRAPPTLLILFYINELANFIVKGAQVALLPGPEAETRKDGKTPRLIPP
jgi:hypothetical protein